jgi:hypothetical protein
LFPTRGLLNDGLVLLVYKEQRSERENYES